MVHFLFDLVLALCSAVHETKAVAGSGLPREEEGAGT